MIRFTLIALFTVVGGGARAVDPVAVKALQGEWQMIEVESKGKKATKDHPEALNMRFSIKGNDLLAFKPDGTGNPQFKRFEVDPAKAPEEMDITWGNGQKRGTTTACIYKVGQDRLTICMPDFGKDPSKRPKEFKAGADDGLVLLTLERVKAK